MFLLLLKKINDSTIVEISKRQNDSTNIERREWNLKATKTWLRKLTLASN